MTTATVSRTDEQIQKDVLAELKWEPRVLPNEMASRSRTASSRSPGGSTPISSAGERGSRRTAFTV